MYMCLEQGVIWCGKDTLLPDRWILKRDEWCISGRGLIGGSCKYFCVEG